MNFKERFPPGPMRRGLRGEHGFTAFGFFLVDCESAANAQSDCQDPGDGLGEFLHERNLFKQTGHQGASGRASGGNTDERDTVFVLKC